MKPNQTKRNEMKRNATNEVIEENKCPKKIYVSCTPLGEQTWAIMDIDAAKHRALFCGFLRAEKILVEKFQAHRIPAWPNDIYTNRSRCVRVRALARSHMENTDTYQSNHTLCCHIIYCNDRLLCVLFKYYLHYYGIMNDF